MRIPLLRIVLLATAVSACRGLSAPSAAPGSMTAPADTIRHSIPSESRVVYQPSPLFRFDTLPPQCPTVAPTGSDWVEVHRSTVSDVALVRHGRGSLVVRVATANQGRLRPLDGGMVELFTDSSESPAARVAVAAPVLGGVGDLGEVTAGTYLLRVGTIGYGRLRRHVDVRPGFADTLLVELLKDVSHGCP